jgi:starch-binding outer membrane protein, SusD/RagB family
MKKYILISLVIITTLSSCKKFLEEKPFDFITAENFFKTEGDANAALNGVYSVFQLQGYYGRTQWLITDVSGEAMRAGGTTGVRPELDRYTYAATNDEIANWWNNSYRMINRANDVIEKVPAIDMDNAKKNDIVGNARFLRALGYFDLLRSFGDVPLITASTSSAIADFKPSRSPIAAVYTQIINDLKFAEQNCLAENQIPASGKGRVSKTAATALLAKVYLTRASSAAAQASDKTDALASCNAVIGSGFYNLRAVYADVFDCDKENNEEHIFSIQFDLPPNVGNITPRMHYPTNFTGGGSLNGFGSFTVEPAFFTAWPAADSIRKGHSAVNKVGTQTFSQAFFYKFRDVRRLGNDSRTNFLVLRFSDVLLMQSEAINLIDSNDVSKFTGINRVRTRAGLTTAAQQLNITNTPTGTAFVDALVRERGWEFCAEGHRRFDLIRLKRLQQVITASGITVFDPAKHFLFPIPFTEIALNTNLVQNPGF